MNIDPHEITVLRINKQSGYNYRERRHDDWTENYTLYRDKVIVNRLEQRQTVNIPLMKQTIRTLLKDVDDMPVLYFENLDNDKQKELYKNEYWNWTVEQNNMEIQDIVDKRQVFLYGRSFDQWQVVNGKIKMTVQDPMDMLIDRYVDPTDIDSARYLIHTHIFMPLNTLEATEGYDQEAVKRLRQWYGTEQGMIKNTTNQQSLDDKNQKLREMELTDVDSPLLGETIVELSMHFVKRKEEGGEEQIYLYVEAEDMEILMKKPLEEVIGETKDHFWRNHYPYATWGDDVERQDFWSDGIADIVRQPNKVLNAWFSQLVENRTLRNFGMQFYNSSLENFNPGTFVPVPWGWYPVPGNPRDSIQKVDVPELSESLDEMNYVTQVVEKSTGATATQQGAEVDRQITLGEVQLALGEAKERIKGMGKFYTPAWKRRGLLFIKLLEASGKIDPVEIYKEGKNSTDLYKKEISPESWKSASGYRCKVWTQEEKNSRDTDTLQKLSLAKSNMPMNGKLDEVYKRKLLEFADLTPEQINGIMEAEAQMASQGLTGGVLGQGSPSVNPVPNPMANSQTPVQ